MSLLFNYFTKRFFFLFVLIFTGLIPIFASCDLVVRLASVPFSFTILKLFWFMFPLVALFALPVASCLSVGATVGQLFSHDESLFFRFFPIARKQLALAVLFFSFVLTALSFPLVFKWAPESYWHGKQFLIRAAQQQIENLQAKKFHQIASRCTIFFKNKTYSPDGIVEFEDLLLMVREQQKKQYVVTAQRAHLCKGTLVLYHGTIYSNAGQSYSIATFKSLEIAFEKLFLTSENLASKPVKFLSFSELRDQSLENSEAWREWHRRWARIFWQFLFPFLLFWGMMIFAKSKSNILINTVLSGFFFLLSYISINVAAIFLRNALWSLVIFYGIPVGITFVVYRLYVRKWN